MTRQMTVLALGAVFALASAAPSFAQGHAKSPRHSAQHMTKTNPVNPYAGYYDYDSSGTFGDAYKSGFGKGGLGR